MNGKKPDALLVLAIIFGIGLVVSTLTHGDGADQQQTAQASGQYSSTYSVGNY
ncbi:MAG: hypothetical protein P1U67_12905 [Alcanivoracaceae bacterium]|nr:hypothetical protein [Alcanivoracaceae bacterium]